MNYVFVFLGEFGYELLNWQGVVRKFATTVSPDDRIICCSRASLYPLYEEADAYVDISNVKEFKQSTASGYSCDYYFKSMMIKNRLIKYFLDNNLKRTIKKFVLSELESGNCCAGKKRKLNLSGNFKFVFSCERNQINGCFFGITPEHTGIYDKLDTSKNIFKKIEPDFSLLEKVQAKIQFSLDKPFILCQMRNREIVLRSKENVNYEDIIKEISSKYPVLLLSFNTGRKLDSYSAFDSLPGCYSYQASTFTEQALLIHFAGICLFFTEKDFGSHMYVPPLMGKNVFTVAPSSVYTLGTTPIDYWNSAVFRFGGRIIPIKSEDLSTLSSIKEFAHELFQTIS